MTLLDFADAVEKAKKPSWDMRPLTLPSHGLRRGLGGGARRRRARGYTMNKITRFDVADREGAAAFLEDNSYVLIADYFEPQDLADFKADVRRIVNACLSKAGFHTMIGDGPLNRRRPSAGRC